MRKRSRAVGLLSFLLCLMLLNCAVPRLVWPQKDVQSQEMNDPSLEKTVLVASRSSTFKDAIVERIQKAFAGQPVYMKFIGLDQLDDEDGDAYTAVVMINTCIAWGLDRHVGRFLDRHESHGHMIVLTTSGDSHWVPDMKGRDFDAIAAASTEADVDTVAAKIISKIQAVLQNT